MQTYYKELKINLQLALPIMITGLGQICFSVVDNWMIGRFLGAESLAAVGLANAIFFVIFVFLIGTTAALPPLFIEANTRKHEKIETLFKNATFYILILCSLGYFLSLFIIYVLPIWDFSDPKLKIPTTLYLTTRAVSFPILGFLMMFQRLAESFSYTKGVMYATLLANIINALFNYIFILEPFPIIPAIQGVAISSVVTTIFMMLLILFFIRKIPEIDTVLKKTKWNFQELNLQKIKKIAKISVPAGVHLFAEASAFQLSTFICGAISTAAIAAHQIMVTLSTIPFMLVLGVGIANSIRVAGYYSEKKTEEIYRAMRVSGSVCMAFMGSMVFIYLFFDTEIPGYFVNTSENIGLETVFIAAKLMGMAALFSVADGLQMIYTTGLRGMQDTKIPAVIAICCYYGVCLPLGYYLGLHTSAATQGVWMGLAIGLILMAILLAFRYYYLMNRLEKKWF